MHVNELVLVLVDRAPCSILLGVLLTRRITFRRVVMLLNATLASALNRKKRPTLILLFTGQGGKRERRYRKCLVPASRWISHVSSVFARDGRVGVQVRFGSRFLHHFFLLFSKTGEDVNRKNLIN